MVYRLHDVNLKAFLDDTVEIEGILKEVKIGSMKKGGFFATLVVQDQYVTAELVKFGVTQNFESQFELGKPYIFMVAVTRYEGGQNGLSCRLELATLSATDPTGFIAYEEGYTQACTVVWNSLMSIKDSIVGSIAYTVMQKYWETFNKLPAAVSMHHSNIGGLMVHTAGVLSLATSIADFYNSWYPEARINKNLVIAGALLHDIGKCTEYELSSNKLSASYASAGILEPHIISGICIVSATAAQLGYTDYLEVNELIHLISSHHGRLDWGSPVEPHMAEADILSYADMVDATLSRRLTINKDVAPGFGLSKKLGSQKFATYVSVHNN